MGSTIQFNIRGNKPPFVVDLRQLTVDGTIVQTVNLEVSGTTQFTNVEAGNYYIVANDNSGTITSYALNIAVPPTTTTTTTTLPLSANYIIGGIDSKINITSNFGNNWTNPDTPPPVTANQINAISFINNVGYAHGNGKKLYKTIDSGENWTNISSAIAVLPESNNTTMYAIDENIILIGTYISNPNILRSTNGGTSFSVIPKGVDMIMSKFEFTDANTGYAINVFPNIGGGKVIAKTTNGGLNWTNITPIIMQTYKSYLDVSFFGNVGYVVTGNDEIFKTQDGGLTWSATVTKPAGMFVSLVKAISNTTVIIAGTNGSGTINKIAKSSNLGTSWTVTDITSSGNGNISTGSYYGKGFDMIDANNGVIPLLGTTKTLVTNDGGNTWTFGGNTTLGQFTAIGVKRNTFVTTTTTTAAPAPKLYWNVAGSGGSQGRLVIMKNNITVVDQLSSSNQNGNIPISDGDLIDISGVWLSGSGNEVKFRICSANNGEIAFYDKIGVIPAPGWDNEKAHAINYNYGVLGDLTVSLRSNGINPPICAI